MRNKKRIKEKNFRYYKSSLCVINPRHKYSNSTESAARLTSQDNVLLNIEFSINIKKKSLNDITYSGYSHYFMLRDQQIDATKEAKEQGEKEEKKEGRNDTNSDG